MLTSVAARGISAPASARGGTCAGREGRREGPRAARTAANAVTAVESPAAALRRARKADIARDLGLVSSSSVEVSPIAGT